MSKKDDFQLCDHVRLPYSRIEHHTDPGTPYEEAFVLERSKDGSEIVPNGRVNSYAMIQSHADSVSMDVIMAKFRAGDVRVLNKSHGFYGDVTDLPTNLHEVYNNLARAEAAFSELPLEVRSKYNHNPALFFEDRDAVAQFFGLTTDTVVSGSDIDLAKDAADMPKTNPVEMKEGEN